MRSHVSPGESVVVTGGAGFIGSHVVELLLAQGFEITVLDDLTTGKRGNLPAGVHLIQVRVQDREAAVALADLRPAGVIHLAAQTSVGRSWADPGADTETNVLGTVNVLHGCAAARVRRCVFASSAAVYGVPLSLPLEESHAPGPLSPYGVSKLAGEAYAAAFGRNFGFTQICLRYANVYGPRQDAHGEAGVVAIFSDRLARGESLEVHGDGTQTRDFVYVADVAAATVRALQANAEGPVNVGTGRATSVMDLVQLLSGLAGNPATLRHGPGRAGDIRHSRMNITKAAEVLGWQPTTPLEEGLRLTWMDRRQPDRGEG